MSLGKRVQQRRKILDISQLELAKSLGVTPQHISLVEQEKVTPSIVLLAGLATQLGVSVDYLVSGKEGIITDTIPAIKADKKLKLKAKKSLISLVEELYAANESSLQSPSGKENQKQI